MLPSTHSPTPGVFTAISFDGLTLQKTLRVVLGLWISKPHQGRTIFDFTTDFEVGAIELDHRPRNTLYGT